MSRMYAVKGVALTGCFEVRASMKPFSVKILVGRLLRAFEREARSQKVYISLQRPLKRISFYLGLPESTIRSFVRKGELERTLSLY